MKKIRLFSRWGSLYLILIAGLGLLFWESTLQIISVDDTMLMSGTLVLLGIVVSVWLSHHEENLLVSQDYWLKENKKKNVKDSSSQNEMDK